MQAKRVCILFYFFRDEICSENTHVLKVMNMLKQTSEPPPFRQAALKSTNGIGLLRKVCILLLGHHTAPRRQARNGGTCGTCG